MTQATILKHTFDPTTLRPGGYVAVQGTPAYPLLMGLGIAGAFNDLRFKVAGERWIEGGRKAVAVSVSQAGSRRRNAGDDDYLGAGSVDFSPDYFVKEVREYADWPEKWWREAIQNAVDARADRVECNVRETDEGFVVSCTDNGGGMDVATLRTKFLRMGGSSKDSMGTTGGFGKAKLLLLFPWIRWRVATRDAMAEGVGGNFRVEKTNHYVSGTTIEVLMPRGMTTTPQAAQSFIGKCSIGGVRFTVNGDSFAARVNRGRQVESIPGKAEIWHNKSAENMGGMLIRINGLYMFNHWLDSSIPGTVFVELTGRSVDLLSANRDSIRDYELRQGIDAFRSRLSKDTKSALKAKRNLFTTRFKGAGLLDAKVEQDEMAGALMIGAGAAKTKSRSAKEGEVEVTDQQARVIEELLTKFGGDGVPTLNEDDNAIDLGIAPPSLVGAFVSFVSNEVQYEHALKQLAWKPDFLVTNEEEGYKVPAKFMPSGMTPTTLKLAKVWSELCRLVLIQLGSRSRFGVGFVFSSEMAAAAQTHDGEGWLLLNPFANPKRMESSELLNPNDDDDLKKLYAYAIHEATHIADGINYHDEAFSTALTHNLAKTMGGLAQARKIAAGIKTRAPKGSKVEERRSLVDHELVRKSWSRYESRLDEAYWRTDEPKFSQIREWRQEFRDWLGGYTAYADPKPFMAWAQKAVPGAFKGFDVT